MRNGFVLIALLLLMVGARAFAEGGGEATYKSRCAMCHGVAGEADTPTAKSMHVKPLNGSTVKMSDVGLITVINNGTGKMPGYKEKLTPAQVKELVTYVDELQHKK
jgi:mono/diheme cytochrome c family protein